MMRLAPLIPALAVLLSACSPAEPDLGSETPSARVPYLVTADGEVEVTCGNADGWVPSVMAAGIPGILTDDEARRLFQSVLDDPATGPEVSRTLFRNGVDVEWRVLRADDTSLAIGLGPWTEDGPAGGARLLSLEAEGDSWRASGWGGCQLSPVLAPGLVWVEVKGYDADPGSRTFTAEVTERACASGRDPGPFLREPFVVETDETVTIYWTSESPVGGQTCQGNPIVKRTVELSEPLGSRTVLDGFRYPPRPAPAS